MALAQLTPGSLAPVLGSPTSTQVSQASAPSVPSTCLSSSAHQLATTHSDNIQLKWRLFCCLSGYHPSHKCYPSPVVPWTWFPSTSAVPLPCGSHCPLYSPQPCSLHGPMTLWAGDIAHWATNTQAQTQLSHSPDKGKHPHWTQGSRARPDGCVSTGKPQPSQNHKNKPLIPKPRTTHERSSSILNCIFTLKLSDDMGWEFAEAE